jgi:hypothetical protein
MAMPFAAFAAPVARVAGDPDYNAAVEEWRGLPR